MDYSLRVRKPGEGLEQLALPFEGQKLYYGLCAVCWGEDLIDGPHLVGLCVQCREEASRPPIPWEENVKSCIQNRRGYASFDQDENCYYCGEPRSLHQNVQGSTR